MIWPHHHRVEILVQSVDPGVLKNGPLGDGDQLRWGPIFGPNGTPLAPRWALGVPTVIWPHHRRVEILVKSVDPRVVKNGPLGDGDQLRWGPIFWPQWGPIGPKMGPRGSPP